MKTYKLHLVRHGLTQANKDGIYMGGGLDSPLNEEGIAQLRQLSQRFSYPRAGAIFCSPMRRALQTAEILFPDARDKTIVEELRECRFGEFEGRHVDELLKDARFANWLDAGSDFVPAGGESGRQFAVRCGAALLSILRHMAQNGIFEAICVAHGGVIMSMLAQHALPKKPPLQWMTDNGCGYTVQTTAAMLMRDELVEAVEVLPYGYLEAQ